MSLGTSHTLKGEQCPACGYALEMTSGLGNEDAPKPGDITLCFGCASVLVFTDTLGCRKPDPMEMLRIELSPQWPEIRRVQTAIRISKVVKRTP